MSKPTPELLIYSAEVVELLTLIERNGRARDVGRPITKIALMRQLATVCDGCSEDSMRQKWAQWSGGAMPELKTLIQLAAHAERRGWLIGSSTRVGLLVAYLRGCRQRALQKVLQEATGRIKPAVDLAVDKLFKEFCSDVVDGDFFAPTSPVTEVSVMVNRFVERVMEHVVVRGGHQGTEGASIEGESLVKPGLGWSEMLRALSVSTERMIACGAEVAADLEDSFLAATAAGGSHKSGAMAITNVPRRARLFNKKL